MSNPAPNFLQSLERVRHDFAAGLEANLLSQLHPAHTQPNVSGVYQGVHDTIRYALDAPGKRLRPYLVWLGNAFFHDEAPAGLFWLQLAFEATHTYSLIHDDLPILDDDDLRRGRPTMHKEFSEADALLTGDALCAAAYSYAAKAGVHLPGKTAALVQLLHNASGYTGMALGQVADIYCENLPAGIQGDLELLEFIHYHKTGALITGSFLAGFIFGLEASLIPELQLPGQNLRPDLLAGWDIPPQLQPLLDELQDFWLEVGLLFQIKDDLLDVQASAADMGKNPQMDTAKLTYVTLLGEAGAQDRLQTLHASLTERLSALTDFQDIFDSAQLYKATALTRELLNYVAHRDK